MFVFFFCFRTASLLSFFADRTSIYNSLTLTLTGTAATSYTPFTRLYLCVDSLHTPPFHPLLLVCHFWECEHSVTTGQCERSASLNFSSCFSFSYPVPLASICFSSFFCACRKIFSRSSVFRSTRDRRVVWAKFVDVSRIFGCVVSFFFCSVGTFPSCRVVFSFLQILKNCFRQD